MYTCRCIATHICMYIWLTCGMSTQVASELGAFGVAPAELIDMMAGMRITLNTDIGRY